jgi:amino acid adenylation domain-containing protein
MANDTVSHRLANLSPPKRALLDKRMKDKRREFLAKQFIRPRATRDTAPLSFAQERLWFLNQLDPESPAYNESRAVRLSGPLDVDALQQALNQIIARHEVLRTTIVAVDGTPTQLIANSRTVELPLIDLRTLTDKNRDAEAHRLIIDVVRRPFDLSRDLMLRVLLLQLADQEHILLSVKHHVASDGWSSGIFWQELSCLYRACISGESCLLPELPVQYADYAIWQREWLQGEVLNRQLSYWKKQLDSVSTLQLPVDRPRPAIQTYRGARQSLTLPKAVSEGLKALSRDQGITLFMTLLAAFQTLLQRYTGQDDIVVGSPISGRNRHELEGVIGFFVNTLALHTDFAGDPTFRELLTRVREVAIGAYAHQDLPFEKLVEELHPQRSLSQSPLYQVAFALRNNPPHVVTLDGLTTAPFEISGGTAKSDLYLSIIDNDENLQARCEYKTELFEAATIERMLRHFQILLEGLITNPDRRISDLPMLTETEKQQILVEWNDTKRGYPRDKCIHELIEQQAEKSPDAIAVVFEDQQLTYRELNRKANQLAHYLRGLGVGPEIFVGIYVERSLEMVEGLLGILKAGGAYVPLDPEYPQERLAFMLEDTRARVLITHKRLMEKLPEHNARVICLDRDWEEIRHESEENPESNSTAENLAYVIYTSGSTGRPKGVSISHRAVNRLVFNTDYVKIESFDKVAQVSNASFDAATFEIWGALLQGAQLIGIPKRVALSPQEFAAQIAEQEISVLFLTTALFNQIASEAPQAFHSVRDLLFGGEAVDPRWVKEVLRYGPPNRLLHVYGPTESTTFASFHLVEHVSEGATTIPIGCPISNTQIYLLDAHLGSVPVGVSGELYIGGDGLAQGYLNCPELTAEKFIPNPFSNEPGARLYRTGDLARYLADGNIEFLGRLDYQVKIRGFRIELGEIESELSQHPAVRGTAVVMREDVPGEKRIVAYVLPNDDPAPTGNELRAFLKQKLPEYMLPSTFVLLDSLPLTVNGKVDRRILPVPDRATAEQAEIFVAPRTPVEKTLAAIWAELLNIEQIGIHDNFFDLGGHSLLATKMIARIKHELQVDLPVSDLFEFSTVSQLVGRIEAKQGEGPDPQAGKSFSHVVKLQLSRNGKTVFCIPHMGGFRNEFSHFTKLARLIGPTYSFYGIRSKGTDGISEPDHDLTDIVGHHIEQMRNIQRQGPYLLLGECFGGRVTYEIARQLLSEGEKIALVALLDASAWSRPLSQYLPRLLGGKSRYRRNLHPTALRLLTSGILSQLKGIHKTTPGERLSYLLKQAHKAKALVSRLIDRGSFRGQTQTIWKGGRVEPQESKSMERGENAYYLAVARWSSAPYAGKITLIANEHRRNADPTLTWGKLALGGVEVHKIPGNHNTYITENIHVVAKVLKECLAKAEVGLN